MVIVAKQAIIPEQQHTLTHVRNCSVYNRAAEPRRLRAQRTTALHTKRTMVYTPLQWADVWGNSPSINTAAHGLRQ